MTAVPAPGLIVVPARRASTRLPDKLLLSETGRPLLAHVLDRCQEAARRRPDLLAEVLVACDDPALAAAARREGVRAVLTRSDHPNGTARVAEAVAGLGHVPPFVVNVQGDEPELAADAIVRVAETLRDAEARMATLAVAVGPGHDAAFHDPNVVKAVVSNGRAIFFSRAPVPYRRDPSPPTDAGPAPPLWHHHLGVYAYRTDFLLAFASWPPSPLEVCESLEQLRAIEAGFPIHVGVVPAAWAGRGIDTAADYAAFVARHRAAAAAGREHRAA